MKRVTALRARTSCAFMALMVVPAWHDTHSADGPGLPAHSAPSEWTLHGHSFDEQRHSPLTRINVATADRLGLAWTFDDFVVRGRTHRGTQATPLMHDGVLYFTGPWSVVYAIDARTGARRWTYDPEVEGAWARRTCCDAVNRGVALWKGTIYVGTLDGWLVALDAATGKLRWRVDTLIDRTRSYSITGAPRVAGDNVVIGNGGAELGVRGYVSAYDATTGRLSWRFYT
ncbi:MAG: PQQ-binding-like beta-propeller repeat protein, partial [Steroidobacteraceae bacterium]|nr:PQQ-binding-like beta-propeller repeat protein [Steroidobacteraceae bacterium]